MEGNDEKDMGTKRRSEEGRSKVERKKGGKDRSSWYSG
jgi:hypothetical protein